MYFSWQNSIPNEYNVKSYPDLYFIPAGRTSPERYLQARTLEELYENIQRRFGKKPLKNKRKFFSPNKEL